METRKKELREMESLEMSPVEFFFPFHAIFAILFHREMFGVGLVP